MPVATAIGAGYVTQAEHHDRDSAGCEPPSGSQPVILPRLKACKLHTRLHRDRGLQTNAANHDRLREMEEVKTKKKKELTLDLERMPLEPSIQTYSAMTLPFWGRSRYFCSCCRMLERARVRADESTRAGFNVRWQHWR